MSGPTPDIHLADIVLSVNGDPRPATHWFFQVGERWCAVANETEEDWFEDDLDPEFVPAWPNPRTYPIGEFPPSGTLVYRWCDYKPVEQLL